MLFRKKTPNLHAFSETKTPSYIWFCGFVGDGFFLWREERRGNIDNNEKLTVIIIFCILFCGRVSWGFFFWTSKTPTYISKKTTPTNIWFFENSIIDIFTKQGLQHVRNNIAVVKTIFKMKMTISYTLTWHFLICKLGFYKKKHVSWGFFFWKSM